MHSSHTLYPKMELLFLHLIDQSIDSFFFFFLHNKIFFSFASSPRARANEFRFTHYVQLFANPFLFLFFFFSFFRLDPLFIDWSSSRKKKNVALKTGTLNMIFYNTLFLMYALESNLKRTAFAFFLRTIIDIHYITLFLYTLKLDSKLHHVRDGVLSKRRKMENDNRIVSLDHIVIFNI